MMFCFCSLLKSEVICCTSVLYSSKSVFSSLKKLAAMFFSVCIDSWMVSIIWVNSGIFSCSMAMFMAFRSSSLRVLRSWDCSNNLLKFSIFRSAVNIWT